MKNCNPKRILIITQLYPSASTGTSVKTRYTLQFLADLGIRVDVCCLHFSKMIKSHLRHPNIHIYTYEVELLSRFTLPYFKRTWRRLFTPLPFRVAKLHEQKLQKKVHQLTQKYQYDYILYDGFSTLQYAKNYSKNNIYIDDEDITTLMYKRVAIVRNPILKLFYVTEWIRCSFYERTFLARMSQIWAINNETNKRLHAFSRVPTYTMPSIIPLQKNIYDSKSKNIVFSGLLSWMENAVGIEWFIARCWNKILKAYPHTKLIITGQMAEMRLRSIASRYPNILLAGFVNDLSQTYATCALAIAPIFINAGIKIKVLTYLSYGLPVVSHTSTTDGMTSTNGVVRSTKQSFAQSVIQLLANPNKRQRLSKTGHKNIQEHHSARALHAFFVRTHILAK